VNARGTAVAEAGAVLARARAAQDDRTPREAAEAAYVPGGPDLDWLESEIRRRRGLPARAA
jgi:hypothetical protein